MAESFHASKEQETLVHQPKSGWLLGFHITFLYMNMEIHMIIRTENLLHTSVTGASVNGYGNG